ncbi:MAG: RNA-binding S4 domain-containing protein [Bacteroidetes bacterium]|nr:RNA-binding S4 domain-containing protein [Bacteroidota bacterium]MBP7400239.1 RNA-binding S4 domain-containing protein [Chitinophagales bacterium]MBK8487371.1 RNA-binding S4 domain-containing protein [Bacteroidota bacterium]MBK8682889.1 RNA-binding S4 domain-containing protein [Bacteroidota bacterium]MBP8752921.1 RNA-binding S4 domain-containing protein [Chitinophagales bacterium]
MDKCRIDKWLWAVRIYKTRSLAAEAVASGKVRVNDETVKPSHNLLKNKIVKVRKGLVTYQYKVIQLLEKRVGAQLVKEYLEDITPQDELDKLDINKNMPAAFRERGTGRPTKKERRDLDDWKEEN